MSLISVIVPVYNAEEYLSNALHCICCQSLSDIEIICINDGSTDNSAAILNKFAKKDTRIKILHQDKNKGAGACRNIGLKHCKSKYIMFCDADDQYDLDICQKMYDNIIINTADIGICQIEVVHISQNERIKTDDPYFDLKFNGYVTDIKSILNNVDVCPVNKIYKRDIIEKYNIQFPEGLAFEDNVFFWNYIVHCRAAVFIKENLYRYYRRPNSVMDFMYNESSKCIEHLIVAELIFDSLKKMKLHHNLEYKFSQFYLGAFYFVKAYIAHKDIPKFYFLHKKYMKKFNNEFGLNHILKSIDNVDNKKTLISHYIKYLIKNINNMKKDKI